MPPQIWGGFFMIYVVKISLPLLAMEGCERSDAG
jgi:hypothetical protein